MTFRSTLVPPYVRKSRSLEAAIPWLYLTGISSGDMSEALQGLLGPEAQGLSATTVSRLKQKWAQDYAIWRQTSWSDRHWVYVWADGIYSRLRDDPGKLCVLVVIGVDDQGRKHLLAVEDGVRGTVAGGASSTMLDAQDRQRVEPVAEAMEWTPSDFSGIIMCPIFKRARSANGESPHE